MQKDVHFYLTYALAIKAGIARETALRIAWADQFVDECTEPGLHGTQTQATAADWHNRRVQETVIVPFHFVPGGEGDNRWMVTPNSANVRELLAAAGDDPIRMGIALHALQDSYSHEGFTGWEEKANAMRPWYHPARLIPNIGHAEIAEADDLDAIWRDHRRDKKINNRRRGKDCAIATMEYLAIAQIFSKAIRKKSRAAGQRYPSEAIDVVGYKKRKQAFRKLAGDPEIRFSEITEDFERRCGDCFRAAARRHQAKAMELMATL